MKLSGKHIVITGAASGIGLALLQHLEEENSISVICRPSTGLDALRASYQDVSVYEADFSDISQVERAADKIIKGGKVVDLLINNAAIQHTPYLIDDDFRYETIRQEIDVNFTSICVLTYLLMPALLQSEQSTILNMNSGLGLEPKTSSAVYCATKGALNIFSKSLAHQLEDTSVNVRQVFLPLVDTAMTRGRGRGKLSVEVAVEKIIRGLEGGRGDIDVGKVKALRIIQRLSPWAAQKIMKAG